MTKIYIIRHAEAEGNVFRRFHGWFNGQLTPRGLEQVEYLRKRFAEVPVDAVYSSDLMRTCQTAQSIYVPRNLPLHRDARFRERCVGISEDLPYGYLDNYHGETMKQFSRDPVHWWVPGAETFEACTGRFLEGLKEIAHKNPDKTVAVFSHGSVIQAVLMELFFGRDPKAVPLSDNTGVSLLHYENGSFSYEYLGDNSHLPEALSTFALQAWWRKTDNRKEANLYFVPLEAGVPVPEELPLPQGERVMLGILRGRAVGAVATLAPREELGIVSGITLLPQMEGRYYADQLLGCAINSHRYCIRQGTVCQFGRLCLFSFHTVGKHPAALGRGDGILILGGGRLLSGGASGRRGGIQGGIGGDGSSEAAGAQGKHQSQNQEPGNELFHVNLP